jgi:hypothetical protein
MESSREPGPLEKELDEAMKRGVLGTSLRLRLGTGIGDDPATDAERLVELLNMHAEVFGVQRRMILRLAREIDDLRTTND